MIRHSPIGAESRAGATPTRLASRPDALEAGADLRELVLVRLDHREPVPADLVAREIERRLDRDRVRLDPQEVVGGLLLLVQRPCALDVAVAMTADHLRDLRPPEVRGDRHHADTAELEEGERVRVVAAVEVEPGLLGDEPRLLGVVVRLLHCHDVLDLGDPRDRLRLDVDDDTARDVVGDHRQVGGAGDLLEVADDRPLRRLVVVRGHDEDPVDAELRRLFRQGRGVSGVVRAGTRDRPSRDHRPRPRPPGRDRASRRRSASATRRSSRRRRARPSRSRRGRSRARGTARSRPLRQRGTASPSR